MNNTKCWNKVAISIRINVNIKCTCTKYSRNNFVYYERKQYPFIYLYTIRNSILKALTNWSEKISGVVVAPLKHQTVMHSLSHVIRRKKQKKQVLKLLFYKHRNNNCKICQYHCVKSLAINKSRRKQHKVNTI